MILKNQLAIREKLQTRYINISSEDLKSKQLNDKNTPLNTASTDLEDAFLKQIRSLVDKDLSNNEIGMPQLIRALGMSRSQIYRKVKALTGSSPSRFIRSIRLNHAKQLLETSQSNVSEIAYEVGFTSPNYFSDAFFEEFGVRPGAILKRAPLFDMYLNGLQ